MVETAANMVNASPSVDALTNTPSTTVPIVKPIEFVSTCKCMFVLNRAADLLGHAALGSRRGCYYFG